MSQTETHVGKLLKIVPICQTVEAWCKSYCDKEGIEMKPYYDSWEECFCDEYRNKFIIYKNNIYKIIKDVDLDGDDVYHANLNSDGTINYVVSFYNGGCGFSEALGYALENMETS